jgi:hypothetical protein
MISTSYILRSAGSERRKRVTRRYGNAQATTQACIYCRSPGNDSLVRAETNLPGAGANRKVHGQELGSEPFGACCTKRLPLQHIRVSSKPFRLDLQFSCIEKSALSNSNCHLLLGCQRDCPPVPPTVVVRCSICPESPRSPRQKLPVSSF